MKLFNTSDISFVKQYQDRLNFTLPSVAVQQRGTKFIKFIGKFSCVQSIHVAQAVVYRDYTDIDIVLSLYFCVVFVRLLFTRITIIITIAVIK